MTLRLRRLRIDVVASGALHAAEVSFPQGLFVVWADNTMGKSTLFRCILLALGMEAMLTTSQRELPVSRAVLRELTSVDGTIAEVTASDVFLEIECSGQVAAIRTSSQSTKVQRFPRLKEHTTSGTSLHHVPGRPPAPRAFTTTLLACWDGVFLRSRLLTAALAHYTSK
jgi:hypothetical protein